MVDKINAYENGLPYQIYYDPSVYAPVTNRRFSQKKAVKNQSHCTICCLCILFIIFLIATLALVASWAIFSNGFKNIGRFCDQTTSSRRKDDQRSKNICTTRSCVEIANKIIENIDEEASPCDDFFQFACGRYSERRVVPEDRLKVNVLDEMGAALSRRLKFILEQPLTSYDYSGARMAKIYYESCMNIEAIVALDLEPFLKIIDSLGGWPLLPGVSSDQIGYNWEEQAAQVYRTVGSLPIFRFGVGVDMENSAEKLLEFGQLGLSLGSRKYYLGDGSSEMMKVYKKFIIDMAVNFGANLGAMESEADQIIALETSLAEISMSDEEQRNVSQSYNPMTFGQFKKRFTGIDWDLYRSIAMENLHLTDSDKVNVLNLGYFQQLPLVIAHTPKRYHGILNATCDVLDFSVLANYMIWRLITTVMPYMSDSYRAPILELEKAFSGITSKPARWDECVGATTSLFGWPLAATYVKRYFNADAKQEALLVMDYLKRVAEKSLQQTDWMDEPSRAMGLKKLRFMDDKVAYPDYLSNETRIMESYGEPVLAADTYFENTLSVTQNLRKFGLSQLRKPVDKTKWQSTILQANAFYSWLNNEMVFPAGILQPPMFTVGVPKYVNFGSAGFVIGHELTHGYDDQGSRFDHEGNLKPWWGKSTEISFASKTQCFVYQYGNITEPITEKKLNGYLTLGENIADNGGIRMAYSAYQLWKAKGESDMAEPSLPGLDKYTNEQLFFLSFADSWCEIIRPGAIEMLIISDEHSMAKYRVNVPLQNFPVFAQTFGCGAGSKMNPALKCKIW